MKLFVVGHGRHGKDTVAKILREELGLSFMSSSLFVAMKAVWPKIGGDYESIEECYEDRHSRRSEWYDAIEEYNAKDPARLSRELFEVHDMYVGLRARREFVAARDLADLAIWVDASKRKPPEPKSSMTILRDDCDIVIDNNGTEEELRTRVVRLAKTWRKA